MKKLLTIFVCLLPFLIKAQTTYYVSNAGSSSDNGTSPSTTWNLSKVNATTFNPGDKILFKRGDVFVGRITVNQSGTSSNPIVFGAYGTGANPVFNGLASVTSWNNIGTNIWESTNAVTTLPTLKLVLINGINTPMGCLPNRDATYPFLPNYFNIDSHTGTGNGATTITSTSLSTNWTGADIVVRVNHWTLDKEPITSQSGTTVSFTGQTTSDPIQNNWGFWIQDDPRTLDVQNEWYFNPSTKRLRIYSTSQPTNVQVTTVDTMFYAHVRDYITIENIDFKGANTSPVVFSACNNSTVLNCNIQYSGETALEAQNTSNNLDVENCSFADIGGAGIWNTDGGANWILKNNKFRRMDLVSVIKNNDYTNAPIEINAPNSLVQYNDIDSTGYEGIHFRGNDVQIRNNFVNHTSMLRDDGGGIYTGFANETGKIIDGNIVLNSVGNARGVGSRDAAGNGIYNDGQSVGITVTNNTVAHIVSAGIFLNNNQGMIVRGNTVYDIGGDYWTRGCLMIQSYTGVPYAGYQRNNSVTSNIFFQKRPSQVDIFNYTDDNSNNSIQDFGIIDSNFYAKGTDNTYFVTYRPQYGSYQNLNFQDWQTVSGKEAHGSYLAQAVDTNNIKFVYNATKNDSIVSLGANYKDVKGVLYNGSVTLQPYRSAILIYDSPSSPPTVTTSGNQSIATTSTNIFSTPVAGSGHSISSVLWTQIFGPSNATIGTPTTNNTSVSNLVDGQYIFRVTVTQDDGQTAYADVTITASIYVAPPTVTMGANQSITVSSTTISATANWASGHGGTVAWTKISGGAASITSSGSSTTTVTGLTTGSYTFRFTATQDDNQTAQGDLTVNVSIPVSAPTVTSSGNQTLSTSSTTVSCTPAPASGHTITSYSWTQTSGTAASITSPTSQTTGITGLTGTSTFRITVTQDDSQTAYADLSITVIPPPTVTNSGNQSITVDHTSATATATWASGFSGTYLWTQVSGAASTIASPSSATTAFTGLATGTYIYRCTVTQDDGQTAYTEVTIVVNIPVPSPTANAGANQTITLPASSVNLSGSYTTASGHTATLLWTKISGSGTQTIANNTTLTPSISGLSTAGVYVFQLQVTQDDTQTATSTVTITVNSAPSPQSPHVNFPVKRKVLQLK